VRIIETYSWCSSMGAGKGKDNFLPYQLICPARPDADLRDRADLIDLPIKPGHDILLVRHHENSAEYFEVVVMLCRVTYQVNEHVGLAAYELPTSCIVMIGSTRLRSTTESSRILNVGTSG
jgi:hypothetical protein